METTGTRCKVRVAATPIEPEKERLETIWTSGVRKGLEDIKLSGIQSNGVYGHPGYNPQQDPGGLKGVPHLRPHEKEYYRLQNYYQAEVPLFPRTMRADEAPPVEDLIRRSVHKKDDEEFTQVLKNLSNNIAIQYLQPSPNEKVPKFDGDYTKWNAFWQAFTVLIDRNPKLPTVTKLNRLNMAVEGEAHQIISMFEFNEESYELAKMALINEYGDPILGANKMLKDLQNMERVKAGDIEGLRNIHIRSKQLVLRLQRLYPSILEQPILISSIIENKMSPECLRKWEEENTRRRREQTLPVPNKYVQWTLNWLNDNIQTNKRSTIKMTFGDKDNGDKDAKKTSTYATVTKRDQPSNGASKVKTLNNFFTMADAKKLWNKETDPLCMICEGKHHVFKCPMEGVTVKIARERVLNAGACMNCLKSGHYANKCQVKGCRIKGCGKKHNTKLHDPELRGPFFGNKAKVAGKKKASIKKPSKPSTKKTTQNPSETQQ